MTGGTVGSGTVVVPLEKNRPTWDWLESEKLSMEKERQSRLATFKPRCADCRWFKGETCYVKPPTPVVHHVHGVIGIRPTTKPEDFCAEFASRDR